MENETKQASLTDDYDITEKEMGDFKAMERPIFNTLVKAKVTEVALKGKCEKKKNQSGDEYTPAYFKVTMKLEKQVTTPNGTKIDEIYTNYGLQIYTQEDGSKTLYWGGEKADAFQLRKLIMSATNIKRDAAPLDFVNILKGKTVYVKTEQRQNPETKEMVPKSVITQILPDELVESKA